MQEGFRDLRLDCIYVRAENRDSGKCHIPIQLFNDLQLALGGCVLVETQQKVCLS